MKAYLCRRKRASLIITDDELLEGMTFSEIVKLRRPIGRIYLNVGVTDLTAFESSQFGDAAENWKLLSKLKNCEWMSSKPGIRITMMETDDDDKLNWNSFEMFSDMEGPLLDNLIKSLAHLNLKITLQISLIPAVGVKVMEPCSPTATTVDFDFSEMHIRSGGKGQKHMGAFCMETGGELSKRFISQWTTRRFDSLKNVEVSLIVSSDKEKDLGGEGNLSCVDVNKKLLLEEVRTDLEIIAGNGVAVKCLSAFLIVQSEVIKAMLESDMQENQTNRILMEDVSEEGVRALLAYLYCRTLERPLESSVLGVELLEVAHRYLIGGLEEAVKGILLDKPVKWFEAKAAVRLFFFAGKLDNHKDLKKKAVKVLQSKPNEVMACEEYKRLFQVEGGGEEDGGMGARFQSVKELCDALLSAPMLATLPSPSSSAAGQQEGNVPETTRGYDAFREYANVLRGKKRKSNNKKNERPVKRLIN